MYLKIMGEWSLDESPIQHTFLVKVSNIEKLVKLLIRLKKWKVFLLSNMAKAWSSN